MDSPDGTGHTYVQSTCWRASIPANRVQVKPCWGHAKYSSDQGGPQGAISISGTSRSINLKLTSMKLLEVLLYNNFKHNSQMKSLELYPGIWADFIINYHEPGSDLIMGHPYFVIAKDIFLLFLSSRLRFVDRPFSGRPCTLCIMMVAKKSGY